MGWVRGKIGHFYFWALLHVIRCTVQPFLKPLWVWILLNLYWLVTTLAITLLLIFANRHCSHVTLHTLYFQHHVIYTHPGTIQSIPWENTLKTPSAWFACQTKPQFFTRREKKMAFFLITFPSPKLFRKAGLCILSDSPLCRRIDLEATRPRDVFGDALIPASLTSAIMETRGMLSGAALISQSPLLHRVMNAGSEISLMWLCERLC